MGRNSGAREPVKGGHVGRAAQPAEPLTGGRIEQASEVGGGSRRSLMQSPPSVYHPIGDRVTQRVSEACGGLFLQGLAAAPDTGSQPRRMEC